MTPLPHTTPDSWLDGFLAFRDRHSGTIQDVCAAMVLLGFGFVVWAYLLGFFEGPVR